MLIIYASATTYHWRKGMQSTWTMQFFTSVFVLTSSLLLALYTTSRIRHLRVTAADNAEGTQAMRSMIAHELVR